MLQWDLVSQEVSTPPQLLLLAPFFLIILNRIRELLKFFKLSFVRIVATMPHE